MSESLEDRLKKNSSAFDGLLSLIPSKYYYDEDTQEQWKQKKQSKEQLRKNKKSKLDPEQQETKSLSAAEVLKQKSKTAKPAVIPGSKISSKSSLKKTKGQLVEDVEEQPSVEEDVSLLKQDDEEITLVYDDEGNEVEAAPILQKNHAKTNGVATTVSVEEKQKKQENLNKLKERLQQKIDAMKAKRKAPGSKVPGAPKSREQILEERRKKKEQREALKRKRGALEEEEDEEEETATVDIKDEQSDSDVEDNNEQADEGNGVLFQNIVFNDGDRTTSDLTKLRKLKKKKGPANRDIKAHLKKVQSQKEKLQGLDEEKRKELLEKQKWNKVLLQAEGVKVKDDEKLLKKALKNKERQKRKSENQWYERSNNVKKNIQERLKRREDNLQIRKENKGVKRKQQKKQLRKFQGPRAKKQKKSKAGF